MHRMIFGDFFLFLRHVHTLTRFSRGILLILFIMLTIATIALGMVENLPIGQTIYFSFITGLTIGYGHYLPETGMGQVLCIVIGILGVVFAGMVVAIANRALQWSLNEKLQLEDPIARRHHELYETAPSRQKSFVHFSRKEG